MMQSQEPKKGYKIVRINLRRYEEIPDDWNIVPLLSLVKDIQTGFADGERDENGILQLRMNNISDDGNLNFNKTLKVPIPSDIDKYDLKKNDILFNNTNSLYLIGKSTIIKKDLDFTFSNHITRIRTKEEKLVPYFLILLLLKYKKDTLFRSICNTHVGQSGIGKEELLKIGIIYPSVPEQQKIASILSNVDSLIQQTQKEIEQAQRLKKGLLQKLLAKGIRHKQFRKIPLIPKFIDFSIPESWDIKKLSEISTEIKDGPMGFNLHNYDYVESGIPILRIQNLKDLTVTKEDLRFITKKKHEELEKSQVKPYDIIISKTGILGMIGVVPKNYGPANLNQALARIQLDDKSIVEYVTMFLASKIPQQILSVVGSGRTVQAGLKMSDIKDLIIPLPPKQEQDEIVSIILWKSSLIQKLYEYKSNLEALKRGLMQKLLTGQIRVKA